jgi:two-component system, OmpR family, sensor histidine kinase VicK
MADIAIEDGRTRILYGAENALSYGIKFMSNTKRKMDITFGSSAPSIVIKILQYYQGYKEILKRGGKIRCITEVTKDNLSYCKELLNIVTELKHLDGLKGGIATNESEYMATTILTEEQPLTEVIYSNAKEVVSQGQYIFDTFWNNSIPANQKIREIEEGIILEKTELIFGVENTTTSIKNFISNANLKIDICLDATGPSALSNIKELETKIGQIQSKKTKNRLLTEVTKDNLSVCKILNGFLEIRHLDEIKGNFSVTESEYISTPTLIGTQPISELIYSNVKKIVEQQQYIFDILWNKSIPLIKKIKEVEEGVEIEFVEVIDNPIKAKDLFIKSLNSSEKELLFFIPSHMLFILQKEIEFINVISRFSNGCGLKVKILLTPKSKFIKFDQDINNFLLHREKNNITIRTIEREFEVKSLERTAIAIIDRKISIVLELKDRCINSFENSIVFSIYSNNKTFVASYVAIFESLWRYIDLFTQFKEIHKKFKSQQSNLEIQIGKKTQNLLKINKNLEELHEKVLIEKKALKKANEELVNSDKVKNEFISMMSHELRTPLVPIKGYTEMLLKTGLLGELNDKQIKAIQIIHRNVKKQESLVEDMLDCTKLEMGQLKLLKKEVIISDLFTNVINDSKSMIEEKQISITSNIDTKVINKIYCDEKRIEQVFSNLIKNSFDYVPEKGGEILIMAEHGDEEKKDNVLLAKNNNDQVDKNKIVPYVTFTVRDNGLGIPKDKIGDLFKKFYQIDTSLTRKHSGTGLGLIICKGIIEAHGGRIWIDQKYTKGFSIKFSLPLLNHSES